MITSTSSRRPRLSLATLLLLAAAGCSSRPTLDLPLYPNSSQAAGIPNQEGATGTLYRMRRMTPDAARTVAAYYREELVAKRGWTEKAGIGPTFLDGNLTVKWTGGIGEAAPVDPSRTGGQVVVYESNNRTLIELWQHVPK